MKSVLLLSFLVLALAFGGLASVEAATVTVFSTDFNSGVPAAFTGVTGTTGVQGYVAYGTFGGDLLFNSSGGDPAASTILTLTGLPPHVTVNLNFLLAIIDSWDGSDVVAFPDYLNVTVDGTPIFQETLANMPLHTQSYVPPPGVLVTPTPAIDLGFNPTYIDSGYDMGLEPAFQSIPHTANTLTIEWFASGGGWQGGPDEAWGIDNVSVSVVEPPVATNLALGPDPAGDDDDLVATYVYSGSYPEDVSLVHWYELGVFQFSLDGPSPVTLDKSLTTPGELWHFRVTPKGISGGVVHSGDITDASNVVGIGIPTATNLAMIPPMPTASDDLRVSYTYTGDKVEKVPRLTVGDPAVLNSTQIRWYKNGNPEATYDDTQTVPSTATTLGDLWHYTITPRDVDGNTGDLVDLRDFTIDGLAVEIVLPFTVSDLEFEGEDEDHEPSGDNQGIRGSKIWITKGELTGNQNGEIGYLQLQDDSGTWFNVTQGDPSDGNHRLYLITGTFAAPDPANFPEDIGETKTNRIVTDSDGEFEASFILPLEVLTAGSMYNAHDPLDVDKENPANNGWAHLAPARFTNANLALSVVTNNDHIIGVQKPRIEDDVKLDTDDPYKNMDTVEIEFDMETEQLAIPFSNFGTEDIEWLMILPDFSNMDSAFDGEKGNDEWIYNVTLWTPANVTDHALDDLIRAVVRARNSGKLEILDEGDGDYKIGYTISRKNSNHSGEKTLRVFAIDLPSTLLMMGFDVEGVITNIEEFTESITASPLNTARLNILQWTSGTMDTGNPTLQNKAANFDFVVVNPFVNPPKANGYDDDGNPVSVPEDDEWVYVFNEGDVVSIMVQIDPHDLSEDQLEKIDPDEVFVTGNEGATIDDIDVIGDISDLLSERLRINTM